MQLADIEQKIQDLPTLPTVAHQINIGTKQESLTAKGLGQIVSKDPSLTAKLLKLANSAYYGLIKQVNTVDRAITLLGFNTVRNLALTVSISGFFAKGAEAVIDMKGLWHHSLGCAVAAKTLLVKENPALAEEAFLCGIIHDIGTLAILSISTAEMVGTLRIMKEKGLTQSEAEKAHIGFTHQFVGGLLAGKWNFPDRYTAVIRFHHDPFAKGVAAYEMDKKLLLAVYVGNQLAKALNLGTSLDMANSSVLPQAWQSLGIAPKMLAELRQQIKTEYTLIIESWNLA
ncbi:MAG: hypothetical protein A2521_13590 [Deltaproteobacteria bacterium RIFOXYD12_FULL_57_12]|nr:MAG: hypothetical protein A2521_13590 [Deltaproteobacteria bacterium RIFOXYD12_FULL_57_12]